MGCGSSADVHPWAQAPQFPSLGFLEVVLTGFRQVFQEVRNSVLQNKGDPHFSVLRAITPDSIPQHVAQVDKGGSGRMKDNRAWARFQVATGNGER